MHDLQACRIDRVPCRLSLLTSHHHCLISTSFYGCQAWALLVACAADHKTCKQAVAAGAVPPLVLLLRRSPPAVAVNVARCLRALAAGSASRCAAMNEADVLPALEDALASEVCMQRNAYTC